MTELFCVACDQMCAWEEYELMRMGILLQNGDVNDIMCPFSGFLTDFGYITEEDFDERVHRRDTRGRDG